jgi:hypothetical protein
MTLAARTDAFTEPLAVTIVDGEILLTSDEAPVDLALSLEAAAGTVQRLLLAIETLRNLGAAPLRPGSGEPPLAERSKSLRGAPG